MTRWDYPALTWGGAVSALIQLLQVLTAAIGAPGITGVIAKVEARLQGRRLLHRLRLRQPHPRGLVGVLPPAPSCARS